MTVTDEYSNKFGISNSAIKDWGVLSPLQWRKKWIDGEKEDSSESHFVFGSLLDVLLFSETTFKERFYIYDGIFPSEAVSKIMKDVFLKIKRHNENLEKINQELPIPVDFHPFDLLESKELLLESIKNYPSIDKETHEIKYGWQNNWKDDTRIDNMIKEGNNFFKILTEVKGREIITTSLKKLCEELKTILITNDRTRDFFIPKEGTELFFQFEIYDLYKPKNGFTIPRKGCLDILQVNHKKGWVRVVDFKTDQNAFGFKYAAKKYGYCDQLTYYSNLLLHLIKDVTHPWYGYEVHSPKNIVIDKNEKLPYVYDYSLYDRDISQNGNRYFLPKIPGTNDPIGKVTKGWEEKLTEISWHLEKNEWSHPIDGLNKQEQTLYLYEM